jgi:dephospho-CoA kinase
MPEEEKRRRADEILDNSEGKERLYRQVDALLEKYVKTKRK